MDLKQKTNQQLEDMQITGSCYGEKAFDKYGGVQDVPPEVMAELRNLNYVVKPEEFRPPAKGAKLLGLARILPAEYTRPITTSGGKIIAFIFNNPNGKKTYFLPEEILFIPLTPPTGLSLGVGLIEPIYSEALELDEIIALLPSIIRNYAEPKRIYKAPDQQQAKAFSNYMSTLKRGEEPVIWGEIEVIFAEVNGNSKFEGYLDYLTERIKERLKAPLKKDLMSATDSNSSSIMKDYLVFVKKNQDVLREKYEKELFIPLLLNHEEFTEVNPTTGQKQLKDFALPVMNFGIPKNALEDLDVTKLIEMAITKDKIDVAGLLKRLDVPVEELETQETEGEDKKETKQ